MPLDTSTRSGLSGDETLSPRQIRAIRKELLIARASLERLSIKESQRDLTRGVPGLGWLQMLSGFGRGRRRGRGMTGLGGLIDSAIGFLPPKIQPVLRVVAPFITRHPVASTLLSLAINRRARGAASSMVRLLKWSTLAWSGFKAYTAWRRIQRSSQR